MFEQVRVPMFEQVRVPMFEQVRVPMFEQVRVPTAERRATLMPSAFNTEWPLRYLKRSYSFNGGVRYRLIYIQFWSAGIDHRFLFP